MTIDKDFETAREWLPDREMVPAAFEALTALYRIEARVRELDDESEENYQLYRKEQAWGNGLQARIVELEAALRVLAEWSLPRWEPDDPQTEGEEMRLFARRVLGEEV